MPKKVHQPSLTDPLATADVPHLVDRSQIEQREAISLAPYASRAQDTKGRLYPEAEHPYRTVFQRDKDRIIHSTAFRRLEYKTQVFVNYMGDYYRTRLTHTIEVSQIARSIARTLRLNEDLTEAMALCHDLGHTPFGHCGEDVLNELMVDCGGFDHNAQGLRVVGCLERRYPEFPGLNLSREVLAIFLKHRALKDFREAGYLGPEWDAWVDSTGPVALEAQVVDLADEIAYCTHDIDDGLTSGYITVEDLADVQLWRMVLDPVRAQHPSVDKDLLHYAAVKNLINLLVTDLIKESLRRLEAGSGRKPANSRAVVSFSAVMLERLEQLRLALQARLYRHHLVLQRMDKSRRMLQALFRLYTEHAEMLAPEVRTRAKGGHLKRVVCDYLAGMTDRSAEEDYKALFMPSS